MHCDQPANLIPLPVNEGIDFEAALALHAAILEGCCEDKLNLMLAPFIEYSMQVYQQQMTADPVSDSEGAKANAAYSASVFARRGVMCALWGQVQAGGMSEKMARHHAKEAQEHVAGAVIALRF